MSNDTDPRGRAILDVAVAIADERTCVVQGALTADEIVRSLSIADALRNPSAVLLALADPESRA